jgi:PAS domain S-box-containing protein
MFSALRCVNENRPEERKYIETPKLLGFSSLNSLNSCLRIAPHDSKRYLVRQKERALRSAYDMNSDVFDSLLDDRPVRVLLVDDDEDSYLLTRHHLSKISLGRFLLDWAPSYEQGLALIGEARHDVYLLDYRLGARTGIELLKEALALGSKAPMIMLTTENPEVDAEAMKLGAADFLSKDKLDPALLERSIRYSIKHFHTLQQLREREAQMAAFMKNVPCAVYMKSTEGRYIYANETCAKVFRRTVEEVIGKTDADLLPKTIAAKARNVDQQVLSLNKTIETTESYHREDGTHYWLTTRFPICDHNDQPMMVGGAAIEITENKRLEKEVQEISEQEKRRIGQDLHDGLGQYLTGIACMVKVVEQKLASRDLAEAGDVKKITTMVNETIAQARDLARGLSPVELENNGLQAALQELASRVSRTNVHCEVKAPTFTRVYDNAAAVHLYRIAQEAVNNAIKHGNAQNITIGLSTQNNQVELTVQDDGCGLPKNGPKTTGMGLRVMNYRASMIGATVSIGPASPRGTLVRVVVSNRPPHARDGAPGRPASRKPRRTDEKAVRTRPDDAERGVAAGRN